MVFGWFISIQIELQLLCNIFPYCYRLWNGFCTMICGYGFTFIVCVIFIRRKSTVMNCVLGGYFAEISFDNVYLYLFCIVFIHKQLIYIQLAQNGSLFTVCSYWFLINNKFNYFLRAQSWTRQDYLIFSCNWTSHLFSCSNCISPEIAFFFSCRSD